MSTEAWASSSAVSSSVVPVRAAWCRAENLKRRGQRSQRRKAKRRQGTASTGNDKQATVNRLFKSLLLTDFTTVTNHQPDPAVFKSAKIHHITADHTLCLLRVSLGDPQCKLFQTYQRLGGKPANLLFNKTTQKKIRTTSSGPHTHTETPPLLLWLRIPAWKKPTSDEQMMLNHTNISHVPHIFISKQLKSLVELNKMTVVVVWAADETKQDIWKCCCVRKMFR